MTRTVLVVEDTDVCREALEVVFAKIPGLVVHCVGTAEQALEYLSVQQVCAVVTDVNLPGMDGFALIQRIRSLPNFGSLPVVVISGDADPHTPIRIADSGASAYFPKPYSPAAVCSKLEQLVNVY
jgi:CheY-like chemotaxis protein